MRCLVVALLALACCEARPNNLVARAGFSAESYILGGSDASAGEFPWQLSQQRQGSTGTWSHSCGASLLSSTRALSAAHCVDQAEVRILRVLAGLLVRTDPAANGAESDLNSYTMHPEYNIGSETFANDIAILHLKTAIDESGSLIQYATLPADDSNNFAGTSCVMSGWGRTSSSNVLPLILQKASIGVITTAECNQLLSPVSGAMVGDMQICLFDTANMIGSCNGDSGGPLNCDAGARGRVVAGVTSWGIQSGGACAPSYPSIYTRTSTYLAWINGNM
jgi:pancreatic elastase II